jgi:hypothetical protein
VKGAAGRLHLLSPNMMLNSALAELGSLVLAADTAHCLFGCCAYMLKVLHKHTAGRW